MVRGPKNKITQGVVTDQALSLTQNAATNALAIVQVGAATGISLTHQASGQMMNFTKTPANSDIQISFTRSDGSGDADMYFTYWGQSNINTLALTNGGGAGLHLTTSGNVVVNDFTSTDYDNSSQFKVVNRTNVVTQQITKTHTGGANVIVVTNSGTGDGLLVTQDGNGVGIRVSKTNTGTANCITVSNSGTGRGIRVDQAGAEAAITITQSGANHALEIVQSDHTNRAIRLTKSGTGGNAAVDVVNSGTGEGILITQVGAATALKVDGPASGSVPLVKVTATTAGDAMLDIDVGSTSGTADPVVRFLLNGTPTWTLGVDNTATDAFRISFGSDLQTDLALTISSVTRNVTANNDFTANNFLKLGGAMPEVTISGGVVTATRSAHTVDTEGDAASDDLDTINGPAITEIIFLVLSPANSTRTVVVKDGTGNLRLNGDFSMDHEDDRMLLISLGNTWYELTRSSNAT